MQQNHQDDRKSEHHQRTNPHLGASDLLHASRDKVKRSWEARIRKHVRGADAQSSLVLVNSLDQFLGEVIDLLAQEDPSLDKVVERGGMSVVHGRQRAGLSGYFVPQLLKEFSILRSEINETLHAKELLSYEVRCLIDSSIDAALSKATEEFATVQQNEIKSALARAESSNRNLEHFAAIAAHDLKSPIGSIAGYLSFLREEHGDKIGAEGAKDIESMQNIAAGMLSLIDRLLEYSHLIQVERPFERIDLTKVLDATKQNLNAIIEREDAKITSDRLPVVMGDAQLLGQVFQNLIANAIKFRGNQRPEIHIGVENENDKWLISVRDNGVGFDPKHKDDIFALFNKLHGADVSGAGIGLATCRRVIELHGGKIWADSIPGTGSTFQFSIPRIESSTHH